VEAPLFLFFSLEYWIPGLESLPPSRLRCVTRHPIASAHVTLPSCSIIIFTAGFPDPFVWCSDSLPYPCPFDPLFASVICNLPRAHCGQIVKNRSGLVRGPTVVHSRSSILHTRPLFIVAQAHISPGHRPSLCPVSTGICCSGITVDV